MSKDEKEEYRGYWRGDGRWQCDCGGGMKSSSHALYIGSHAASVSRCSRCDVLRPLRKQKGLSDDEKAGRAIVQCFIDREIEQEEAETGLAALDFDQALIRDTLNTARMYRRP